MTVLLLIELHHYLTDIIWFCQLSPEIIFGGHSSRSLPDAAGSMNTASGTNKSTLAAVNPWGYTGESYQDAMVTAVWNANVASASDLRKTF